jgi:NADH-quinone oxidoreductase subunit L
MYLTITALTLIGYFITKLFKKLVGPKAAAALTTLCSSASFYVSSLYCYRVVSTEFVIHKDVGRYVYSDSVSICWDVSLNNLNVISFVVITFVLTLVHLCSITFMSHDQDLLKFMSYLSLITFFMLIIVILDSIIPFVLATEGLFRSFRAMTDFWITRAEANKTAMTKETIYKIIEFFFVLSLLISVMNSSYNIYIFYS